MRKVESALTDFPDRNFGPSGIVTGGILNFSADMISRTLRTHADHVLVLIRAGVIGYVFETEYHVVSMGMMIFIPADSHYFELSLGVDVLAWHINVPIEKSVRKHGNGPEIFKTRPLIEGFCEKIINTKIIIAEEKDPTLKRLVMAFVDELDRSESIRHLVIPAPKCPKIFAVAHEILMSPGIKENLDYWAKKSGMSRRAFTDRFFKEMGLSFDAWRKRVLLQASLIHLSNGLNVKEIADLLEFSTPSAFVNSFRSQFGFSPKSYLSKEDKSLGNPKL